MRRQIRDKKYFPDTGVAPVDIEEDLPFLPDSMKSRRVKEKTNRDAGNSDIPIHLFHVNNDSRDKREADTASDFGSLESGLRKTPGLIETEYETEEADVFSDRKYVVLIIYDIISNKQRVKMAKLLSGYGNRVQKSAFEARLNKKQYARFLRDIRRMLNKDDNVRIYRLHGYEEILTFGDKEYEIIEDVIVI